MKVDKQKLVIFEEKKDLINVWKDFFSTKYKLSFINIKSSQNYINSILITKQYLFVI